MTIEKSADAKTEDVHRSCPICEASCGLVLQVDRKAKQVLSVRGDDDDPRSRGYICPKAFAPKGVYEDPDRIRKPLRRKGSNWEEIGWDEALEYTGTRLREIREQYGQHNVGTYIGNPTGHNVGAMLYTIPFIQVLDTQRLFTGATVDQFPKNLSCRLMYGDAWLFPIPDIDRTDFFLVLGANPLVSNGSLLSAPNMRERLRELRARGSKVVVLDPRRTETANAADEHHFIRPGTDAHFLFAVVNVLFAEDLVDPGRLADFTDGIDKVDELARPFTPEAVAAARCFPGPPPVRPSPSPQIRGRCHMGASAHACAAFPNLTASCLRPSWRKRSRTPAKKIGCVR